MRTHVFLNVVERRYNPFYALLKEIPINFPSDKVHHIQLSKQALDKIVNVEYSWKKQYRFLFYKKVATEIKYKIENIISSSPKDYKIYIYLTDEGVWSEIIKHIIKKQEKNHSIKIVMVQHGLHYLEEPPKLLFFRKLLNQLSIYLTGHPSFGYGFIGSKLDTYLVYTEKDRDFIKKRIKADVFSCPHLIKSDFIKEFTNLELENNNKDNSNKSLNILFAMEPIVPSSGVTCNEHELHETLGQLIKKINGITKNKVIFRPHPGSDYEKTVKLLSTLSYSKYIKIDENISLNKTLIKVDIVMSIHSTVLFDAWLIGKVPVQVVNQYEDRKLHLNQEIIDTRTLKKHNIENIFSLEKVKEYQTMSKNYNDDICWSDYLCQSKTKYN